MKYKKEAMLILLTLSVLTVLSMIVLNFQGALYREAADFPDKNLEAAIRDAVGVAKGRLVARDLARVTKLDASGRGIKSLQGMEQLKALRILNLEDNQIQDVSPLKSLRKLTELSLRNNGITCLEEINFAELKGLPLRKLSLRHNVVRPESGEQVRLSDVRLLGYFTSLEELELRDNHIAEISFLQELVGLQVLDLRENRIKDISPILNLTNMCELNLRENDISDLTPLSNLAGLTYLNIHSNPNVQSVLPLKDLTGLRTLIMRNVPVHQEVFILENMSQLQRLNLGNCMIADISVLEGLTALEELNLSDNDIRDLSPLPSLSNLVYLNLESNLNVQSLEPLKELVRLETLIMPKN